MSADPTAEHIDAVARILALAEGVTPGTDVWHSRPLDLLVETLRHLELVRNATRRILTSTDPAVHAALAASLPAEVKAASMTDAEMLAALVDRGNDAELARRLEWATGLIGATLLVAIRSEGLEVVRVKPEQVAP